MYEYARSLAAYSDSLLARTSNLPGNLFATKFFEKIS